MKTSQHYYNQLLGALEQAGCYLNQFWHSKAADVYVKVASNIVMFVRFRHEHKQKLFIAKAPVNL